MEFTNITESGSNNTLRWALQNGADVKNDVPLQSLVNDELFYLITYNDVNFFELFRLTQVYRDKVRIIDEKKAEVPSNQFLQESFPGGFSPDPEKPDLKSPLYESARYSIESFLNLTMQMMSDEDIISTGTIRMIIPMIARRFTVQIPISFMDFISGMSEAEMSACFNQNYPYTLQDIVNNPSHGAHRIIELGFVKATNIIKYNKRYDKYLNVTKYRPLRMDKNGKIYKFALLSMHKFNPITHGENRLTFFNVDKDSLKSTGDQLKSIKSPLKLDFVIQLPIQYMQILLSSYSREDLPVLYESSISSIIDSGLDSEQLDFILPTDESDEETPEENHLSAYKIRINEANQNTLACINLILTTNQDDVDITDTFSLLPSIYMTKAMITVDLSKADLYLHHFDSVIREMFSDIMNNAKQITDQLTETK